MHLSRKLLSRNLYISILATFPVIYSPWAGYGYHPSLTIHLKSSWSSTIIMRLMMITISEVQSPHIIISRDRLALLPYIAPKIYSIISTSWYTILFLCHWIGNSSHGFTRWSYQDSLGGYSKNNFSSSTNGIEGHCHDQVFYRTDYFFGTASGMVTPPFFVFTPLSLWINIHMEDTLLTMLPLGPSLT